MIGILFFVTIDPSQASTPFPDIENVSYFQNGSDILFSMHVVFRIEHINRMDDGGRLFEVQLSVITDSDEELRSLTTHLSDEAQNNVARTGIVAF
ncbi:unnamed protein product [Rotaria socialis]|nr:unnamed protein product [Rotaria socialis]CAF3180377.1 unnamed protein product [Rotaria socialis]CAF3338154.1 unnamed protein product [Rotaria socialis]CAF3580675.1 unnamed protein product [Rotaria socialis]CAF4306413.1 unnamed protein product [Rotaria socialis]